MERYSETKLKKKQKLPRYAFIDVLRGICLVSMIAYHTMWDCVYIFGVNAPWFKTEYARIWQQSICWMFIFLSGFCFNLGRNHLKRGLLVFGGGVVITVVTLLVMPEDKIIFGVLTLIGSAMLILTAAEPIMKKIPPLFGFVMNFIVFIFCKNVPKGYIGFENTPVFLRLPDFLYKDYFTAFLGFKFTGFRSSDYFPLIPWLFLFFAGYFFFMLLSKKGVVARWKKTPPTKEFFSTIGRYSFWIYMAHQPVVYGILFIIFKIIK